MLDKTKAPELPGMETPDSASPQFSEFSWRDLDVICVRSQPAVAVYKNPRGEIVIRQESQFGDDDHWICLQPENVELLAMTLNDIAHGGDGAIAGVRE